MRTVLMDTKKALGVDEESKDFDIDILMHINTAFFLLMQLGLGPEEGFEATESTTWNDYFKDRTDLFAVKSYIFVVVRLAFDRPETSYGIQALERMRDEWAWRLEFQRRELNDQK